MPKPNVREKIVEAGLATLRERGFNATSVQDITTAAGVPKGSFYNHFESKDALGVEVVERYKAAAQVHMDLLSDRSRPPLDRLRAFFASVRVGLEADGFRCGCMLGALGTELANQCPEIRASVLAGLEGWADAMVPALEEAGFPEPLRLARVLMAGWQGALMIAKVEGHGGALDDFLAITFDRLLA